MFFHFQQLFLPLVKPTLHFLLAVLQCTKRYSRTYYETVFTFQTWYCSFAAVAEAYLPPYFRKIITGERLFPPANTANHGSAVLERQREGPARPQRSSPGAGINSVSADTGQPNPPRGVLKGSKRLRTHTDQMHIVLNTRQLCT